MKKISKFLTLVLVALTISFQLAAQCKSDSKYIGWLSKMLRVKFTITEPANITFTTKPASIYEIPFALMAYASFVKAGNEPFFYLWTSKDHFKELTDFKKGDKITFYLSGGSKIESSCYSDYQGIKGQTISFYQLTRDDLVNLSATSVDSIIAQSHLRLTPKSNPSKVEDDPIVLRKFSKRNVDLIMEWAKCLKENL